MDHVSGIGPVPQDIVIRVENPGPMPALPQEGVPDVLNGRAAQEPDAADGQRIVLQG